MAVEIKAQGDVVNIPAHAYHKDSIDFSLSVWTRLLVGCVFVLACQCALAQAMYRINPLGHLGGCTASAPLAYGFNEADQVTGQACNAHGDMHAFVWKNGSPMVDLGPAEVGSSSIGYAINASGLVAGNAADSTGTFAFVSSGNGSPMTKIPNSIGGTSTTFGALNNVGQVTGSADIANVYGDHVFLWKNDGSQMADLGDLNGCGSYAQAINDTGQVVGSAYDCDRSGNLFIWRNDGTPMTYLGSNGGSNGRACCINASGQVAGSLTLGYSWHHAFVTGKNGIGVTDLGALKVGAMSFGNALNYAGDVAGYSAIQSLFNSDWWHAVVWMNGGTIKDLKTFGGKRSQANDINASGQVTGWAAITGDIANHAFLWRNDGTNIQDLNTLIDPTDPSKPYVTLTVGEFINKFGDIVADGTDSRTGLQGLYLLQGTVLTLSPRSLAFGSHPINTASAAKSVTMTNTSRKPVAISSVALTGTASGQFASTNNCGKSLAGHAICTIKVTFRPTTKGAKSAFLNVNGGGGGLRTVTLTGTGA